MNTLCKRQSQNGESWGPIPINSCNTIPITWAQRTLYNNWQNGCKEPENQSISVRLFLIELSETIPMKFHQHDCPNTRWKRTVAMHMLMWTEKCPGGLNSIQKFKHPGNAGNGTNSLTQGGTQWLIHCPIPNGQTQKHAYQSHCTDWAGCTYGSV